MKHVISLGAGVQSSTMALMAAHGEITPMPECAIFADTQSEPRAVYTWLDWLEAQLPFPVYRVTAGRLADEIAAKRPFGKFRIVNIPAWVVTGKRGERSAPINRSCTRDYKIDPIRRKVRELLGIAGKHSPKEPIVTQWIGISKDEASRMKPSREAWQSMRWPLIEAGMSRVDCLKWMERRGYPKPPKSSCIFCPYHSNEQWLALTPDEFRLAVDIDRRLRAAPAHEYCSKGVLYLHRSCRPLEDVDFRTAAKRAGQGDLFANECEGLCNT